MLPILVGQDTTGLSDVPEVISPQITIDSLAIDTSDLDTLDIDSMDETRGYRLSPDAIDARIEYGSVDSQWLDNTARIVYLYGDAYVRYTDLSLTADFIRLDLNTHIASAQGVKDSSGTWVGTPVFKDKSQEVNAHQLEYNFENRVGLIYDVSTQEKDMHILSARTKFFGAGGESGRENHIGYSHDAIFTTCDHPIPHFGIRSKKQKVVQGKVAVVGPSNLEIGGVPTPLYLPFGFFPLKTGKTGGLMFPNNYAYSNNWGFGLENVGYFIPISDHFDFTLLTDFYFRGSWGLDGELRYKKRYKYDGNLSLGYSDFVSESVVAMDDGTSTLQNRHQKSFFLRLRHNQNSTAHPYRTLGGSINIESNQHDRLNYNSADRVLNNALRSNFSLTQQLPGTPFTLSLGLSHSQNTNTRLVNMSLPTLDIRMRQINPFKRKTRTGPERWYEKLALTYRSSMRYELSATDTTFFEANTWRNGKFGVQHQLGTNVNFNVLKYFQLSPFINFKETWYTRSNQLHFVDSLSIAYDTIINPSDPMDVLILADTLSYGRTVMDRVKGFNAIHQYDAGVSLFTKVYGTVRFNKGWFRGLRHTMKPSVSISYSPDYRAPELGYFDTYRFLNENGEEVFQEYNRFTTEIFGGPTSGERFSLNYSILNLFEAKVFSKRDSSTRKISILDNFNVSGNYNFAADSFHWSPISFSGNFKMFEGRSQVKIGGSLDPYAVDKNGQRINRFERDVSGRLFRFQGVSFSFSTGMRFSEVARLISGQGLRGNEKTSDKEKPKTKTILSIFENLSFRHQFIMGSKRLRDGRLIFQPTTHSIAIRGDIPLSPKWIFSVSNIDYNFVRKGTSYPDLSLSRDLHCWTMGVSWQPERNTYGFYIRVKPGSLDFINLPYNRNREDGFRNL